MSLVKHETDYENGQFGDFDFALRVVYDSHNLPISGIVYIGERQNRIRRVDLPITVNPLSKVSPTMEKPIKIDFKPLETSATDGGFEIENLEGFLKEITRKWKLVNAIRKPEGSFLRYNPASYIDNYPELTVEEYLSKLPESKRTEIRTFLKEEK